MSIYSKTPYAFRSVKSLNNCISLPSNYEELGSSFLHLQHSRTRTTPNSSGYISLVSKHNQTYPVMEGERNNLDHVYEQEGGDEYSKDLDYAVRAVQMACFLCQKMKQDFISTSKFQEELKNHSSHHSTVAGWSVQSIVSLVLTECLGSGTVCILAEQDVQTLANTNASLLLEAITETVNECLAEAPRFGLKHIKSTLSESELLEVISSCNSTGNPTGRFWALQPVDGKSGFLHEDQYVVSLSLIEDGEIVLGVLGCPNHPMRKEWLSYHHRYRTIMSKLTPATSERWDKGCILYARKGSGKAWMQPLLHGSKKFMWPNSARPVRLSTTENSALATFCDPVERPNSNHSFAAGVAHSVGLRYGRAIIDYAYLADEFRFQLQQIVSDDDDKIMHMCLCFGFGRKLPLRVHSMVKYAAIARGDAEIFMKFGRAGNKEKLWDHAAGVIIIQEAGGVVTDAGGKPLDFSKGKYLERLDRGIVACAGPKLHDDIMEAMDTSWSSSCL